MSPCLLQLTASWGKTLDETGTQVATCMINRWTVKMNGAEEYITTEISQERRRIATLRTPESSGREASENWEEEEFILELSRRIDFYLSSTLLMIPLPNDPARPLMKSSLRPSSLPNLLYWACWVWVRSHLQWRTPQIRTTQYIYIYIDYNNNIAIYSTTKTIKTNAKDL